MRCRQQPCLLSPSLEGVERHAIPHQGRERSRGHFLWLLAGGMTATAVASTHQETTSDADLTFADAYHLQPAFHRPVGRVDPLIGGVACPPLPRVVIGIAGLEREVAARTQGGVNSSQGARRGLL